MARKFRLDSFGYEVEIGKFARQADGAVMIKHGGTLVLSTAVAAASKEFPGFFPLTIDYREQFSAAGKIPGGYYKREGKSSDREVLTSRLIDRAVRPLFPADFFDQVQVLSTVYSVDKEHVPSTLALIASSLALTISRVPFLGPVGVVEVGRINGEWVFNPTYQQTVESDVRLVIAGTKEGVSMVECSAKELSEDEFVDLLERAHEKIKEIVAWQESIQKELAVEKEVREDIYDWAGWTKRAQEYLTDDKAEKVYIADKATRNEYLKALNEGFVAEHSAMIEQTEAPTHVIDYILGSVLQEKITELMFTLNKRIDGRAFDEVRKISVDVGLLPFTHGSAMFTRGQTQALVSVTLGGGQDEQRTETIMDEDSEEGAFMLHYNFPPFSVGEVKPLRGPGRREVGHGHLARSAFDYVRPTKEEFPYTIRLVADVLESNGSSSMATACGSTMALMQAGVPIKKMIGGIAMGLIRNQAGDFKVLSDISGFEDAYGLMDFKVVGTDQGITAIQMDIKHKGGFSKDVFKAALEQARQGRLFILGEMRKVMDKPAQELSELVPKVTMIKIDPDKIGAIIGSGGKTIREIIEVTGTAIDVEPDGLVKIFGPVGSDTPLAVRWVKTLAGQINRGEKFAGKVKRVADFGLFVELVPGTQGLVHVSNIPRDKQKTFARDFAPDSQVTVEVLDYDEVTGRISLRLLLD